ncbi:MAG: hypothetical protein ACFFD4_30685 [Candidatus Odinarchaeota archaeon]
MSMESCTANPSKIMKDLEKLLIPLKHGEFDTGMYLDDLTSFLTTLFPVSRVGHFFDDNTSADREKVNSVQVQLGQRIICDLQFDDYELRNLGIVVLLKTSDFEAWKKNLTLSLSTSD